MLIIESSALYGPKPLGGPGGMAPPPPPPVAPRRAEKKGRGAEGGKGKKAQLHPHRRHLGEEPLDRVKEAVEDLLENMPPPWKVFVINYGEDVTAHPPFRPPGPPAPSSRT